MNVTKYALCSFDLDEKRERITSVLSFSISSDVYIVYSKCGTGVENETKPVAFIIQRNFVKILAGGGWF